MALNSRDDYYYYGNLDVWIQYLSVQFHLNTSSVLINNHLTSLTQGHFARQDIKWGNNARLTLTDAYSWYFRGLIEFPKSADIGDFLVSGATGDFNAIPGYQSSLSAEESVLVFSQQGTQGPVMVNVDLLELCIRQTAACWRLQYSQSCCQHPRSVHLLTEVLSEYCTIGTTCWCVLCYTV